MKILFIIWCLTLQTYVTLGQTTNATLLLGISMPVSNSDFSEKHVENIESKITSIIKNTEIGNVNYGSDFVVSPSLFLEESSTVDGGIQPIIVTTIDVIFNIEQLSTGVIFNSLSKKIKGSGYNKEESITNALNKINTADNVYLRFVTQSCHEINDYYNKNCNQLISKANDLSAKKDYEQAISILQSIPNNVYCYKRAQQKAIDLFKLYEKAFCSKYILLAKARIALHEYSEAMDLLELTDPNGTCIKEKDQLILAIEKKIDKEVEREQDITKLYINAITEIGKAYFLGKAKSRLKS